MPGFSSQPISPAHRWRLRVAFICNVGVILWSQRLGWYRTYERELVLSCALATTAAVALVAIAPILKKGARKESLVACILGFIPILAFAEALLTLL